MIKIISHGTRKKHACQICGCIFTYEKEDVEHYVYEFIRCPQCKEKIILK